MGKYMGLLSSFAKRVPTSSGTSGTYLCSFHIPKTGGTTFASHARKSLGDDAFLLHGPFSRVDRFMRDLLQLEELSVAQKGKIKIVHGHGAGLALAEAMVGRMPEFMVIVRDPYERFVSGFHHYNNERKNNGLTEISDDRYFRMRGNNFYANSFFGHFKKLVPAGTEPTFDNLMPVLQSIKYFVVTEHLDNQLQDVCAAYGLPAGPLKAQRVNKMKSRLSIDRTTFERENEADMKIYQPLFEAATRSPLSIENPFGYKPQLLKTWLENVWLKQSLNAKIAAAYDELIDGCKKTYKLQAAKLKLAHFSPNQVSNKALLVERIDAAFNGWLPTLDDNELSAMNFWSGVLFLRQNEFERAEEYLKKAISFNPKNDNALAHLAKSLYRRGEKDDAVVYIKQALALNPRRSSTRAISQAILGNGWS